MWMHDDVALLVLIMHRTAGATPFRQVTRVTRQLRPLTDHGNALQNLHLILTLYQDVTAKNPTTGVLANATEWGLLPRSRITGHYCCSQIQASLMQKKSPHYHLCGAAESCQG